MLELAADLLPRLRAGERIAVVTVTRVSRSAPRGAGASMAVTAAGEVIGSISGGCVEEDAVMLALRAISTGSGLTASFGFSDDDAHAAGLACGGAIDVVAHPLSIDDVVAIDALEAVLRDEAVAVGLVIAAGSSTHGAPVGRVVPIAVDGPDDSILTLSYAPRPRLVILGAGDYAAALCRVAAASGFAVTVCDGWGLLVTPERFADADLLVTQPPHEYLRADADPLTRAPRSACSRTTSAQTCPPSARRCACPSRSSGALGARRTVARRAQLLRAQGVTDEELARLHSPLGLDLGAETPQESAISILAEIIAARRARLGCAAARARDPDPRRSARAVSPRRIGRTVLLPAPVLPIGEST